MKRCQRLRILQLGPAPDQGPDPDLTPDLTRGAVPAQDQGNVAIGKSSFHFLTLTYIIAFLVMHVVNTHIRHTL